MRTAVLALAAILLASCTTTSTIRVAADQSIITTRGNAFTSPEMVEHDLLLQAATQAQAAGFEWFTIDSTRNMTTHGVLMTPAQGNAEASGNAYGWRGSASYTGSSFTPYIKPGVQVVVHFGNGPKPKDALSAAEIIALNPKR